MHRPMPGMPFVLPKEMQPIYVRKNKSKVTVISLFSEVKMDNSFFLPLTSFAP